MRRILLPMGLAYLVSWTVHAHAANTVYGQSWTQKYDITLSLPPEERYVHSLLISETPDIPELLDNLVSPNPAPARLYNYVEYPSNYDIEAQQRVYEAIFKLAQLGLKAFPYLTANYDSRYCLSEEDGNNAFNCSVYQICCRIIVDQVDRGARSYQVRSTADGSIIPCISYFQQYSGKGGLARWWSTRSHLSLLELQIETVEWVIQEELRQGFPEKNQDKMQAFVSKEQVLTPLYDILKRLKAESAEQGH